MCIKITEFSKEYSDDIRALVVGIQRDEFGFPVNATHQPDLQHISEHYLGGLGNFWIALSNDRLVGSIGLMDLGGGQSCLRKMFVHPEFRGLDVATLLFERLLAWAKNHHFSTMYLGTTSKYHAAHRFYEKNGFTKISAVNLPKSFPQFEIEDCFYFRPLGENGLI